MKYKTIVLKYNPRAKKNGGRNRKSGKRICRKRLDAQNVFRYSFLSCIFSSYLAPTITV